MKHFPFQRFISCLIADLSILLIGCIYKDWLWHFANLDPTKTSGAHAITAISAFAGIMITGIVAVQIFLITGSTKTIEAMFKMGSLATSTSTVESKMQEYTERKERPRDHQDLE
jgi:hypothetical protein